MAQMVNEILYGLTREHKGKHDIGIIGLRCVGLVVALGLENELLQGKSSRRLLRTYKQRVATARWRERRKVT